MSGNSRELPLLSHVAASNEPVTVVVRPLKDYARSNPSLFLRIVRAVATETQCEFVIKVGRDTPERRHEGLVYDGLGDDERVVPCLYHGPFAPPFRLPFVASGPVLPRDAVRALRAKFAGETGDGLPRLYLVATLFRPSVASVEERIRDGPPPDAGYVTDAVRTVRRLFDEKGLVHFDLHHHNQLIDRAASRLHLLDMDFATIPGLRDSAIFNILPIDMCGRILCRLTHTDIPDRDTRRDRVGHAYDIVMLYTAYDNARRRTPAKASAHADNNYCAPSADERKLFRSYQMAEALTREVTWKPYVRERIGSKRLAEVGRHVRLLLTATVLVAIYSCGVPYAAARRRLLRTLRVQHHRQRPAAARASRVGT